MRVREEIRAEKSRRNESKRGNKSREGIEMARNVVKKMRQKNKERAMIERKCFFCRGFGHIVLWNTLDTNIFLFLLSIFLDFILLFF